MVKKKRQVKGGDDYGESTESCEENASQNCLHVNKAVSFNTLSKTVKSQGLTLDCAECQKKSETISSACDEEECDKDQSVSGCSPDPQLWMCLQCGTQLCSRGKNQHALEHFKKPHSDRHDLVINTTTWQVFCYTCQRAISYSSTKKLQEAVEYLKKHNMISEKENDVNIDDKIAQVMSNNFIKAEPSSSYMLSNHTSSSGSPTKVWGLYNFGNTCFFNSVMQCLIQTPYLTTVLRNASLGGNQIKLEGGKFQIDDKETELPSICGELGPWGQLTEVLTTTLETLNSPVNSGVYKPHPLFKSLVSQFPQFGDGEQHDSHELLRQLLEGVRNEDLRRYQAAVLRTLDLVSKEKRTHLDNETKKIVKFYGQKAAEKLLGPEQVFRGFLVSTLECQECLHTSERTETFLDLSLPVTAEKPQPPAVTRRKGIPEEQVNCVGAPDENKPSKYQLKKERQAARKMKKSKKGAGNTSTGDKQTDNKLNNDTSENKTESKSSSEQSDADVEDNLDENTSNESNKINNSVGPHAETAANFALYHMESGYNSEKVISSDSIRASPVDLENKEKSDASPERLDKEEQQQLCLSAVAIPLEYRPLSRVDSPHLDSGVASPDAGKSDTPQATSKELGSPSSLSSSMNMDMSSPRQDVTPDNDLPRPVSCISLVQPENLDDVALNGAKDEPSESNKARDVETVMDDLTLDDGFSFGTPPTLNFLMKSPQGESSKWKKNSSYFPSATVSPRYQCDEGEYSVQSCLNQFTSSELLAGNNKVGCEACTKRANSEKTIYTNATKRFLISSPPAVLILHLKRFQLGPRCMFRKINKHVNFPLILDLAPFCSDKIKSLPIVSPTQNKLLYSLYGVVEHSGSMHGGHYVAYVKVRSKVDPDDKRWTFLPTDVDDEVENETNKPSVNGVNSNGYDDCDSGEEAAGYTPDVPSGKWFYISDSRVQEIAEDKVLKTEAYLLFYERIM